MTCQSQLVSAFMLAHMMKSVDPNIHIVLGGGLVTELAYRMVKNPRLWEMFDSLIEGPGEVAFTELIERLEKKQTSAVCRTSSTSRTERLSKAKS